MLEVLDFKDSSYSNTCFLLWTSVIQEFSTKLPLHLKKMQLGNTDLDKDLYALEGRLAEGKSSEEQELAEAN